MGEIFKRNWKRTTGVRAPENVTANDLVRLSEQGLLSTNATGLAGQIVSSSTPLETQLLGYTGGQWGPVSASGSGGLLNAATVGAIPTIEVPNPDYTTLRAALDAGHRVIHVVSDTTEASNIIFNTVTSGVYIKIDNGATVNLTFAQFRFVSCSSFVVEGNGTINQTNAATAAFEALNSSVGVIRGITIQKPGTTVDDAMTIDGGSNVRLIDCKINARRHARIRNASKVDFINCTFDDDNSGNIEAGVRCESGGLVRLYGCLFRGTYTSDDLSFGGCELNDGSRFEMYNCRSETLGANMYLVLGDKSVINGFTLQGGSNSKLHLSNTFTGGAEKAVGISISNVDLGAPTKVGGINGGERFEASSFHNVTSSGEGLNICRRYSRDNKFTNCRFGSRGGVGTIDAWGFNNTFNNCIFFGSLHVNGSGNIFTGCEVRGTGLLVYPETENNLLVGMKIGQDVTFMAGSSGNIISSSIIDGQINTIGNNISSANVELNL